MTNYGLIGTKGVAAPPFTMGPYTWDQAITFSNTVTINSDLTVTGNFTFGDASTDNLIVTGYQTNTYTGTAQDAVGITASGALAAGKNGMKITVSNAGYSSTSHGLHVLMSGAGTAGAYGVYINATGANAEGLKVDAGTSQFDEAATFSGGIVMDGAVTTGLSVTGATTFGVQVTGNASTAFDCQSGSFTTGLSIAGTVTNGIIVGASTNGVSVSGATTTAMAVTGATTTAYNLAANATDGFKVTSGTVTNGFNVAGGTITTGMLVSGAATTGFSVTGACSTAAIAVSGTQALGLDMSGTYSDDMIYLHPTSMATGKRAIRIGVYGTEIALAAGEGLYRSYGKVTSGSTATVLDFHWGFTEGATTAQLIGKQMQMESHSTTPGPVSVQVLDCIAGIDASHFMAASVTAGDGLLGGRFKVYGDVTATCSGDVNAIWLDSQMSCAVGGIESSILATTGGTVPDAFARFVTTSSGWANLLYFDALCAPVTTSATALNGITTSHKIAIQIGATTYYIPVVQTGMA